MTFYVLLRSVALLAVIFSPCEAFMHATKCFPVSPKLQALPSIDDLRSDGFMKQVGHASELVEMIGSDDMEQSKLTDMIKVQLSHSDGIRAFFANYLTKADGPADLEQVPALVNAAMMSIDDQSDLVAISCMNVIMPIAMSTIHKQAELQINSHKTAVRALKILVALNYNPEVERNCKAIHAAATENKNIDSEPSLVEYWTKFFDRYGYQEQQRSDIADAMKAFLS